MRKSKPSILLCSRILPLCISLSLVACGSDSDKSENSSSQSSTNSSVANSSVLSSVASSSVVSSSETLVSSLSSSSDSSSSSSSDSSSSSSSDSSSSSMSSVAPSLVLAINAGSFSKANYQGVEYQPDEFSTGGSMSTTADPINGTDEDGLFQSERYGSYSYEIPVTDATYSVTLHFVEMYWTAALRRSFNVKIEGQTTDVTALDLFAQAGHDTAYSYTIEDVAVDDGYLTIQLESVVDNGTLSGFAIYSADGEFIPPPPPPPPPPPVPEAASPENVGADCVLEALPALAENALLPDPFKKYDGTRIAAKADWRCHRQEIVRQAEASIYGTKPPKPQTVSGSVTEQQISVTVENEGKSASFTATVSLPQGTGPFPAVIDISSWASSGGYRDVMISEGVAVITLNPYLVGSEQSANRNNKAGAFYTLYGNKSKTGLLVAWSWGVSRLIDVLESSGTSLIKSDSVGVIGCSRFGKAAFTIGAFDQRIALTMPFESGSGGVPVWRSIPGEGAQSPTSAYGETYWLGDDFAPFTSNVKRLPVDTHQIISMIAPRGLFIMDNPHIANLGPRSAHLAALAGAEVYKALGAESNISYHSNVVSGSHCAFRPEHEEPLRLNLQKFLKGQNVTTGIMNPHPTKTATLSEWIDWATPELTNE